MALIVVNGTYEKLATHPPTFLEQTEKAAAKTAAKLTEMGFSVRHKTLNIIYFTWEPPYPLPYVKVPFAKTNLEKK